MTNDIPTGKFRCKECGEIFDVYWVENTGKLKMQIKQETLCKPCSSAILKHNLAIIKADMAKISLTKP